MDAEDDQPFVCIPEDEFTDEHIGDGFGEGNLEPWDKDGRDGKDERDEDDQADDFAVCADERGEIVEAFFDRGHHFVAAEFFLDPKAEVIADDNFGNRNRAEEQCYQYDVVVALVCLQQNDAR